MLGVDPRLMANAIRFLSMDAIERAGEGHPGTPLGAADIATALFTRHLKFNPQDPLWFDRDRFVQSPGHGSMLIYSLLYLAGYEKMGIEEIKRFRVLGSHCEGHPEYDPSCGIEVTTGLLGQGIANAAGMAVAEAFLSEWLGPEIVDHYTYALVGDGCLQEGIGQEVISLAGHLRLGKLVFLWDDNRMTDDGAIDIALADDMPARFRVSGWHVQEVDGHDPEAVSRRHPAGEVGPAALDDRLPDRHRPRHPGRGRHARRPTALASSRPTPTPHGNTWAGRIRPSRSRRTSCAAWRETGRRSLPDYDAWQARVAALPADKRRVLDRLREGRLPDGWEAALREFKRRAGAERLTPVRHQDLRRHCGPAERRDPGTALRRAGPRRRHAAQAPSVRLHGGGPRWPLRPLRHPRACDGGDAERHGGAWRRRRLRRHLSGLHRLHAGLDAHGGHDGPAGAVRVQPRFHRCRHQRADAPAGRVPGLVPGDAQHAGAAPGRRGRGGRVLGDRARAAGPARPR